MFQDSSKKGREKVYVSRPNAMMISRGATMAALPLSSLPIQFRKRELTAQLDPKKNLVPKIHEGAL